MINRCRSLIFLRYLNFRHTHTHTLELTLLPLLTLPPGAIPRTVGWCALPRSSVVCAGLKGRHTHTHGVKMAMRAVLRCLSANFSPGLPQLSPAARLTATRPPWRSCSPRTLSTTSALSTGKPGPGAVWGGSGRCCAVNTLHAGWLTHSFLRATGRDNSRSFCHFPTAGAAECDRAACGRREVCFFKLGGGGASEKTAGGE